MKIRTAIAAISFCGIFSGLSASSITAHDTITANALWDADTVKVTGGVTIANGATLTIAAGTRVEFQGYFPLQVQGRLLAVGTKTDSIVFTPRDTAAGWHGIRFIRTPAGNDSSRLVCCRLDHGRADSSLNNDDYSGGAIAIAVFSRLLVSSCAFFRNSAYYQGGAIYCEKASPVLTNNTITGNRAGYEGGAIYCGDSCYGLISGNTLSFNTAGYNGGGIMCYRGANPVIRANVISGNRSSTGSGGGVYCTQAGPVIENNVISNNAAKSNGGGICLYLYSPAALIGNCITRNTSDYQGGAVYIRQSTPKICNNTIAYNAASYQGNGVFMYYSSPTFVNTINWANNSFYDTFDSRPQFVSGNSGNPRFKDTASDDFSLCDTSPCIDRGNSSLSAYGIVLPDVDVAGNPRISGVRVDIGAYEYQSITAVRENKPDLRKTALNAFVSLNYPNPFAGATAFTVKIPGRGNYCPHAAIMIHDMRGRLIKTLFSGALAPGFHHFTWNGNDADSKPVPNGFYFIQLKTGNVKEALMCLLSR